MKLEMPDIRIYLDIVRIRHYGILSASHKRESLGHLRQTLGQVQLQEKPPLQHRICPRCKKGKLITLETFTARGPPPYWITKLKTQQKAN